MANDSFEALVIGSGATGGVAALTLAQKGIRVLVVEAGPSFSLDQALGSEPLNTISRLFHLIKSDHVKQAQHPGYWKSNPALYINEKDNPYTYPKENPFIWTQGHQVGGRSLTWGGITLRLSDINLKAAQKDGFGSSWPIEYKDIEEHYTFLEKLFKVYGNRDGLNQLPDGLYEESIPFTESEEIFAKRVKRNLGYSVIHSRGFTTHQYKSRSWPKSSSLGSTLKKALETGKVKLLTNHIVESLIVNNNSSLAEGVIAIEKETGNRKKIKSQLIVLSASTIQTLKILLNSESKNNSKGFVDSSGNLGCYLMDHISTCRFFSFPKDKNNKPNTSKNINHKLSGAGSFFIPFGDDLGSREEVDFIRGYGIWGAIDRFDPPMLLKKEPNSKIGFLIGHGEVLPYKNNKVTLSKNLDKWGIPIPHIDCKWNENELRMVKHMNKTISSCIKESGGKMLPLKDLIKMPFFIEKVVNTSLAVQETPPPPGYYIHEVGGAGMGKSPDCSVLDNWNRLWQCKNVLVVDGACWPTSSWQSPTLTMMALTRRACLKAINHLKG